MGKHDIPPPPFGSICVPYPKELNFWLTPCKIIILSHQTVPIEFLVGSPIEPPHYETTFVGGGGASLNPPPPSWGLKITNLLVFSDVEMKKCFQVLPWGLARRSGMSLRIFQPLLLCRRFGGLVGLGIF